MIVHAVDAYPMTQASAWQVAYYNPQPAAAPPPTRVASSASLALPSMPAQSPAPLPRNKAPCSIQRGYADGNGWGGVIAECGGTVVSVGGQMDWDGPPQAAAASNNDNMRRVLLRSLQSEGPGSRHLLLPSIVMLVLAALALFFVARSFKEEAYRG